VVFAVVVSQMLLNLGSYHQADYSSEQVYCFDRFVLDEE
jgi:hypothetical protein